MSKIWKREIVRENKNINMEMHLLAIPEKLAYSLGALLLSLGFLLIYFWYKKKIRKKLYEHIFAGNLKAKSPRDAINKIPSNININAKKTLAKHPIPTFGIRNTHLFCLYGAIIFILFALTLLFG